MERFPAERPSTPARAGGRVIEGGVISFVRADHIGRPVFATNASGVKTWTATYTPFGTVHTSTPAPPSARFPGQWFQSESGLHENWMRDYDPTTGRYLQADPLGLVDGASVYGNRRAMALVERLDDDPALNGKIIVSGAPSEGRLNLDLNPAVVASGLRTAPDILAAVLLTLSPSFTL